jgi:hypothetical protein
MRSLHKACRIKHFVAGDVYCRWSRRPAALHALCLIKQMSDHFLSNWPFASNYRVLKCSITQFSLDMVLRPGQPSLVVGSYVGHVDWRLLANDARLALERLAVELQRHIMIVATSHSLELVDVIPTTELSLPIRARWPSRMGPVSSQCLESQAFDLAAAWRHVFPPIKLVAASRASQWI